MPLDLAISGSRHVSPHLKITLADHAHSMLVNIASSHSTAAVAARVLLGEGLATGKFTPPAEHTKMGVTTPPRLAHNATTNLMPRRFADGQPYQYIWRQGSPVIHTIKPLYASCSKQNQGRTSFVSRYRLAPTLVARSRRNM